MKKTISEIIVLLSFFMTSSLFARQVEASLNFYNPGFLSIEDSFGNYLMVSQSNKIKEIQIRYIIDGEEKVEILTSDSNLPFAKAFRMGKDFNLIFEKNFGEDTISILLPSFISIKANLEGNYGYLQLNDFTTEVSITNTAKVSKNKEGQQMVFSGIKCPAVIFSWYAGVKISFASYEDYLIRISSVFNDLEINLPAKTKANLKAKYFFGKLSSDFELENTEPYNNGHIAYGKINGGGQLIDLQVGGYSNLTIKSINK